MPYSAYKNHLHEAGFGPIQQFVRMRQLPLANLDADVGPFEQIIHCTGLCYETARNGLTSLVVAQKR